MTDLTGCMAAICDPEMSTNPVAWFELEQAGLTREHLKEVSEGGDWMGPKPVFNNAPSRDDAMWKYLARKAQEEPSE